MQLLSSYSLVNRPYKKASIILPNNAKPAFGRSTASLFSMDTSIAPLQDIFQSTKAENNIKKANGFPPLTFHKIETRHDPIIGDIHIYRFSNGLTFYGLQKKDVPLVCFGDLYHVGSGEEHEWNDGAAHILEHMIFKGTKAIKPGEYSRRLENMGAYDNALTDRDYTLYYINHIPKESLGEVIKLQAGVVQRPLIDAKELDKERGAILEEFNRFYNQKVLKALDALYGAIWPDHTYGRKHFGLGPKENIRSLKREELLDFYGKHYSPKNHTIIAVGDFDLQGTLKEIAHHYNLPFPPSGEEYPPNMGKTDYSHRETPFKVNPSPAETNIHDEDMTVAIHSQGAEGPRPISSKAHRELVALDMLSDILGGGESSRLHQQLVEKDQLATHVSMSVIPRKERSGIFIDAQTEPKNLDKVRKIIRDHLDKAQQELVTEKELHKTRTQNEEALASATESTSGLLGNLANGVGTNNLHNMFSTGLKTVRSITPEEIRDAANKYLSPERMKQVNLLPAKDGKSDQETHHASQITNSSSKAPSLTFAGRLAPHDKSHILKDGTELIVRHKPGSLRTAISIKVKGGNAIDPQGLSGLNVYMADLMSRGTPNLSATDLQHRLEDNSLSLGISSGETTTSIDMSGLTKFKDEMVALLSDIINNPAFDQKELDFNKKQMRENHQANLDLNPKTTLNQLLAEARYPNGHPYGITINRMLRNADRFTPEKIRQAYTQQFRRPNITIAVSGGLSDTEAIQMAENILGNLPGTEAPLKGIVPIPIEQSKTKTAAREKMEQIELKRLWDAPSALDPDKPAMQMLNAILSGGSSSRLFKRFREDGEHSLAYEVGTRYRPTLHSGAFTFYVGTDPQNTTKVQKVLQEELDRIIEEPPTQEELERAKQQYKTSYLSTQESNDAISEHLSTHRALGTDSLDEALAKLDRVTPEQVQGVAKEYLGKPSITAVVAPQAVIKEHSLPDPEV